MALRKRYGKWHYRFMLDGREYSAATDLAATARNESEARQLEAEHRKALKEGRTPERRLIVREFNDAVADFLKWAESEYRAHPNTHRRIATSLASAKEFLGKTPVGLITEAQVESSKTWRSTKHEVRDVTIRHDLHALSVFFKYAIKLRWTRENPIKKVRIPSDADAVRIHVIIPEEEREYFRRAAKNRNLFDLAVLIRNQGMRSEEVLSLQTADVDLERGQVHVRWGKTRSARCTLTLTAESRRVLAARCNGPSVWVFPSDRKSGAHIKRMNNAHDTACAEKVEKAALNFVLYDFRHTFATRMAQTGGDLPTLAAILGHNSIRMVEKYVHPTSDHQQTAMNKLEATLPAIDYLNPDPE